MSQKLDYLKKYMGGASSQKEQLKKRLLKSMNKEGDGQNNIMKKKQGFRDEDESVITFGVKKPLQTP